MGGVVGSIVARVLVDGLRVVEWLTPMPSRLGTPLPIGAGASRDADPVVLITGFDNSPSGFDEWRRSLQADGFQVFVVELPSVGLGDMVESAEVLAEFVARVKRRTGRARVDLVGFSEGGLLARMYASRPGAARSVDRVTTFATPHAGITLFRGTYRRGGLLARLLDAATPALRQLHEGSALLAAIERSDRGLRSSGASWQAAGGAGLVGRPRYASVYSNAPDLVVAPGSANLPGAVNVPVREDDGNGTGPNHFAMFHMSDRAYEAIRALLLDHDPREALAAGTADR